MFPKPLGRMVLAIGWLMICAAFPAEAGYRLTWTPRFSVNAQFTDNLFLSNTVEESDMITVFSPGFNAQIRSKTASATLSYETGYSMYNRYSENNSLRHNATLSGELRFTRHTSLSFQNSFRLTEEPLDTISPDEQTLMGIEQLQEEREPLFPEPEYQAETETVRRSRQQYYTDTASLTFSHQFGPRSEMGLQYGYRLLENDDPRVEDEESHTPSFSLVYWPRPDLGIQGRLGYNYNERSQTPEEPGYWDESLSPSAELTWIAIPEQLTLRPGLSYMRGEYSEPVAENAPDIDNWYESLTPSLEITYTLREWKTDLDMDIAYEYARFANPGEDFDNLSGGIRMNKAFSRRFSGFAGYRHEQIAFRDPEQADYTVHTPELGFSYQLTEEIPLSLSLGYPIRVMENGESQARFTLNGDLGKEWTFKRGAVSFSADSGYDMSYFGAEQLGFGYYYNVQGGGRYTFSEHLSATLSARFQKDEFTEKEDQRDDTTTQLESGIIFRPPGKWLTVRLNYLYQTVDATEAIDSYTENRVTATVTLAPARPIRF